MATFTQLRARVTKEERALFDFLWEYHLREKEWPTHHIVYRDFLEKPELDKLLKKSSGALVLREQEIFQLRLLGVWCTSQGESFVEWTRKLIGYLRDLYYAKDPKEFITSTDVMAATGLSEADTMLLGRTLEHTGFYGIYPYFNPTSAGWQITLPRRALVDFSRTESIDGKFDGEVNQLAAQAWEVDHVERAQALYRAQPKFMPFEDEDSVVDNRARRYQVFVSSTYEDLKDERNAVIQALLESDCIPVGMELFPAADAEQWELIQRLIGECDYYVLIVAGRYGSSPPRSKISYTEREYDYARRLKIPTLSFYHSKPGSLAQEKCETKTVRRRQLAKFIKKVTKRRMCKSWLNSAELAGAVKTAVHKAIKSHPRPGWVRASAEPTGSG